jgi:hypothetical protein
MLLFEEKIHLLHKYLLIEETFADSFKYDVMIWLGELTPENANLVFLKTLANEEDIKKWVDKLTSRIVMKYDEEFDQLSDIISDYVVFG